MSTKKKSTYEELDIPNWNMSLAKLEDFVNRAKAAGHNTFDIILDRGYYDDIEGYTLRSEFSEGQAELDKMNSEPAKH